MHQYWTSSKEKNTVWVHRQFTYYLTIHKGNFFIAPEASWSNSDSFRPTVVFPLHDLIKSSSHSLNIGGAMLMGSLFITVDSTPSKRKGYQHVRLSGRSYQHFFHFLGEIQVSQMVWLPFIQWCIVQVTENDGSFNSKLLISAVQF